MERGGKNWPGIPWGLDPITAPTGVAVGLATDWWIGLVVWIVMTVLLWAGWIWTRKFVRGEPRHRPRSFEQAVIWACVIPAVTCGLLAYLEWGVLGGLACALGFSAYFLAMQRLAAGRVG